MEADATHVLVLADAPEQIRRVGDALAGASRPGIARFHVALASRRNGDGLARLAAGGVDIVILDVTTAPEEGLDTLVRARIEAPDVPVVLLTAGSPSDERLGIQAVEVGAQDVLTREQIDSQLLPRVLHYAMERQRLQTTLRQLSLTDELTGLYNKRGFLTLAEHHLKLAHRTRGLILVRADIPGLREVNQALGRDAGDRLIVAAAKVLRQTFRASDVVARLGGDDFAALALDATDETIDVVTPRLHAMLNRQNAAPGHVPAPLRIALGIVRADPAAPPLVDDLLVSAERRLAVR